MGLGMAKKAKQREAAALQEAIAAGMVKAKGRGKKQREEKGGPVLQQLSNEQPKARHLQDFCLRCMLTEWRVVLLVCVYVCVCVVVHLQPSSGTRV